MHASPSETVSYWSFDMAHVIVQGTDTVTLTYDSEHARISQQSVNGSTTTTTTYLNDPASGLMDEKVVSNSTATWNDYLMVDGKLVGEHTTVGSTAATTQYFVLDHLDSVAVVTDQTGALSARQSYDSWGRERNGRRHGRRHLQLGGHLAQPPRLSPRRR